MSIYLNTQSFYYHTFWFTVMKSWNVLQIWFYRRKVWATKEQMVIPGWNWLNMFRLPRRTSRKMKTKTNCKFRHRSSVVFSETVILKSSMEIVYRGSYFKKLIKFRKKEHLTSKKSFSKSSMFNLTKNRL